MRVLLSATSPARPAEGKFYRRNRNPRKKSVPVKIFSRRRQTPEDGTHPKPEAYSVFVDALAETDIEIADL